MGITDYEIDDGIVVVAAGTGWSIWHEPTTDRWRFDVFAGGEHRALPMKVRDMNRVRAYACAAKLWSDAFGRPGLTEPARELGNKVRELWPA